MFREYEYEDTEEDKWQDFKDDIGAFIYSELYKTVATVDFDEVVDKAISRHYDKSGETISRHDDYFSVFESSVQKVMEEIEAEDSKNVDLSNEYSVFIKDVFVFIENNVSFGKAVDEDFISTLGDEYINKENNALGNHIDSEEAKMYFEPLFDTYIGCTNPEFNINDEDIKVLAFDSLLDRKNIESYIKDVDYDIASCQKELDKDTLIFAEMNREIISSLNNEKKSLRLLNDVLSGEITSKKDIEKTLSVSNPEEEVCRKNVKKKSSSPSI